MFRERGQVGTAGGSIMMDVSVSATAFDDTMVALIQVCLLPPMADKRRRSPSIRGQHYLTRGS